MLRGSGGLVAKEVLSAVWVKAMTLRGDRGFFLDTVSQPAGLGHLLYITSQLWNLPQIVVEYYGV